jgi:hypothetical protein
MSSKMARFVVCLCGLMSLCGPFVLGQATGSFSGTVSDNSGAVVAGAKVTITSEATNISREAVSDDAGRYLVPLLGVGDYTLHVEAAGFKAADAKDVRLQIDEHRELDFKLVPASVSTNVEVSATELAVQTGNPTLGQVITSQQVAELPLNGRDFVQLATLTPGVTQETNPNSFFNGGPSSEVSARGTYSLSVGGSRAQSTDWLLDGVDNNELTAGGIAILPSIDAIQEFKVLTYNYSAEYGTRSGPTVLVTTKAGSNQFHGSLFEFFRNTKLDAKTFDFGTPSAKQQFNLNQFGGALGGPIQKDKTFFFLDYQAKRQRHGIPFTGVIPTPAMMGGDFSNDPFGVARPGFAAGAPAANADGYTNLVNPYSPTGAPFQCDSSGAPLPTADGTQTGGTACNKIPVALAGSGGMADPSGLALIQLYPQSNASNPGLGYNYTNTPVRRLNEGEFDIRVDHNFSSKDSAFGRFSYDQAVSFVPGGSPGFAEQGAFASTQNITNHGRNVAVSETHLFSDRTINQASFGFNRIFNHILSFGTGTCEAAKIGIQGADLGANCDSVTGYPSNLNQSTKDCVGCGLSSTQLTGYWSVGDRGFSPFQGGTNVFHVSDTLDLIRGKHDIKIGGGIRANQMNVLTNGFGDGYFLLFGGSGSFTGDDAADLLLGQVGGSIHDQTFLGATTGRRWKMFRPFVQDDWRVSPDLTLNLGLAWSLTTPITEAEGRQANFDYTTGQYLVTGPLKGCAGCVASGSAVGLKLDKTAFEPRIGLAWKPWGSQKTAVRAGYAIYHDSAWSQGAQGTWQNPPYYAEVDNFNYFPGAPCPYANASSPTPQNCGLQLSLLQANLQPILTPPAPSSFTGTTQTQPLNFKQGMVQQFNLNVEHQLPGEVVLTVGYAGSRSSHILNDGLNQNIGAPTSCAGGPTASAATAGYTLGCGPGGAYFPAPYGEFTSIDNNSDNGHARYDSLQVKAEKNARNGLYALLSYTYSRTFDSGFPDGLGTLPGAMYWPLPGASKLDWSLSQLNLNNQFTASVLYDLPFGKGKHFGGNWSGPTNEVFGGWKLNLIEKATSGFPLFVVASNNGNFSGSGVNFAWNGNSLNRPNEVGNPNVGGPEGGNTNCPAAVHTLQNWFNPCAFQDAPLGELGDAPRAPIYGPRFVNTDFSVIKDFPISFREGMNLQFRAEFFNLLNHPHFYLPGTSAASMQDVDSPSSFGVVNSTLNDPRFIQLALKLIF